MALHKSRSEELPGAQDAEALVEATDLTVRFTNERFGIDKLSLSVRRGEVYCLLGGAGSGKTTAIEMLLGLLRPTAGSVRIAGIDPSRQPESARRQLTFIRGDSALCGAMTARQNLEFFTSLGQPARSASAVDVKNALRRMGVPERDFEARLVNRPHDLTIAVWLAVALLRDTPVVILDEPSRGLDSRAAAALQENLLDLSRSGKAILVATADVLFASQVADRIAVLKSGRKVAERTRAQVLGLSLTEIYVEYVGRPPGHVLLQAIPVIPAPSDNR